MNASTKILCKISCFILLNVLIWHYLRNKNTELCRSYRTEAFPRSVILIEAVAPKGPVWLWPLLFLPDTDPTFRFTFYKEDKPEFASSHSYSKKYQSSSDAAVEWGPDGSAVVYLNYEPIFKCDADGFWKKIK